MPDITITIPTPILTGSDYFKVRYRPVPGSFGGYSNQDNDPFVLSGLTAGAYELEVTLVKDGVECPATLKPFTVVDPFTCVTFTPVIVQSGNLFYLQLSYAAPGTPPCGWHIHIAGSTTNKIVNYATLPASPLLIPVNNEGLNVRVYADLCNQKSSECLNTDVPAITPTCTPMVISGVVITKTGTYPSGFIAVQVTFTWTQSSPPSKCITLKIVQKKIINTPDTIVSNYPNFSLCGLPPGGTNLVENVVANNAVMDNDYEFDWLIVDACNVTHTGTVTGHLV